MIPAIDPAKFAELSERLREANEELAAAIAIMRDAEAVRIAAMKRCGQIKSELQTFVTVHAGTRVWP